MKKNTAHTIKILTLRLLTTILIVSSLSTQTRAQLNPGYQVSIKFPATENRGAPERTGAGGRRGGCDLDNLSQQNTPLKDQAKKIKLTPIVPKNNIITSVAANPAVYLHSLIIDKPVNFRVFELDTKKEVYTNKFSLPHTVGIVKVKLPETVELQPNKMYGWQFIVICSEQPDDYKLVTGWLERKNLTEQQLATIEAVKKNPIAQAKLYAEYGIWNETLELLTPSQQNPKIKSEWKELFYSVELEKYSNATINNCCQIAESETIPTSAQNTDRGGSL
jgi:hypothetical protein